MGVSQPEGCGRPGHRITLDADLLQELTSDDLPALSEYRVRKGGREEQGSVGKGKKDGRKSRERQGRGGRDRKERRRDKEKKGGSENRREGQGRERMGMKEQRRDREA